MPARATSVVHMVAFGSSAFPGNAILPASGARNKKEAAVFAEAMTAAPHLDGGILEYVNAVQQIRFLST